MQEIALLDLPHVRARELLATGVPVYLTVNPVEYHGPHLSLHNDRLVAEGLSRRIHAALREHEPSWPFVLAADLEIGAEPCRGAGSRGISFRDERRLVLEAVNGLVELGAQRLVLMTFHGGPLHNLALEAGVKLARARGVRAVSPLGLVLDALITMDDPWEFREALMTIPDARDRERAAARLAEDIHAGFFETSMALAVAGHSVDPCHLTLPECPPIEPDPAMVAAAGIAKLLGRERLAKELTVGSRASGWGKLVPFPGYTGAPHLASVAAGEAFVAHALRRFMPVVEGVLLRGEPPPPPMMAWIETLTLDGLIAPASSFAILR